MSTKKLKKLKLTAKENMDNFKKKNKTKGLYVLIYPLSLFFYFIFLIWIFKKIKWIKINISPIWKIINISVLSSPASVFISFILPIIFIMILSNVSHASNALAGIVAQIPVLILVVAMPVIFVDFKRSSILKRLYISEVKKTTIIFSFVSYFMFLCLVSTMITMGIGLTIKMNSESSMFFETKKISEMLKYINWTSFFMGIFLNMMLSGGIGIIISSHAKTPMFAIAIGLFILIPGAFLSGQFLSLGLILRNDIMKYMSYFTYQKYPTAIIVSAFDLTHNGIDYVQYNLFSNDVWKVVEGFETKIPQQISDLISPEFGNRLKTVILGTNESEKRDILTELNNSLGKIGTFTLKDFAKVKYLEIMGPTLAWISLGYSIIMPIPLYTLGIKMFRWTTR